MKTFKEFINEDVIKKLKEKLKSVSNEGEREVIERKIKLARQGLYK